MYMETKIMQNEKQPTHPPILEVPLDVALHRRLLGTGHAGAVCALVRVK